MQFDSTKQYRCFGFLLYNTALMKLNFENQMQFEFKQRASEDQENKPSYFLRNFLELQMFSRSEYDSQMFLSEGTSLILECFYASVSQL